MQALYARATVSATVIVPVRFGTVILYLEECHSSVDARTAMVPLLLM
jgi:hypothetical protein